jgi:hypothetical protein
MNTDRHRSELTRRSADILSASGRSPLSSLSKTRLEKAARYARADRMSALHLIRNA